ncbi:helicase-related protein [Thermoproteota archaeon]
MNYFKERVKELEIKSYLISGEDNEYRRASVSYEFQKYDGFAILFTSDVMSERIDLQSASGIINCDLPYNPQKIEQRIGRVDRIEQTSDEVFVYNFLVKGFTDQIVYDRLLNRIGVFERAIGGIPNLIDESKFEEGIIDEEDIIRVVSENKIKEEILESNSLVILDQILDESVNNQGEKTMVTL